MVAPSRPDPVRETLIDILRQLNQAESRHEGKAPEQALELAEIELRLDPQRIARAKGITVPLALGLLLRNGLVRAIGTPDYSWQRQRKARQRYQITTEGKRFLVDALESSDRVR